MEHVIRFIVGGAMIVLISFMAENKNPFLAGILSAFPIKFIVALLIVGGAAGMPLARSLAGSMAASLPLVLVFCGAFYLSSLRFSLYPTLALGLAAWGIAATAYVFAANYLGK